MNIEKANFGKTSDGIQVERYDCTNDHGLKFSMITYGAIMHSVFVPDRNGDNSNVNLGCPTIGAYEACSAYLGATVGRFCNRIGNAKFVLDGKEYQLAANNGSHSLHGGVRGFSHAVWAAEPIQTDQYVGVRFEHVSPDGDEGFPGKVNVTAEYFLNQNNELTIRFRAVTDAPTVINLTNHNYWNLAGAGSGDILDHLVQIESDSYIDVDDDLIPTGKFKHVGETPLDFRTPTRIGERIGILNETPANGYDHCYALRSQSRQVTLAASVVDPASGRKMEVLTSQPGIQLYTGNWLDGTDGSGGYGKNEAFCLETQHYPDSPNQETFPTTKLSPDDEFVQTTVHRFGIVD